jgi:hypothetical protein
MASWGNWKLTQRGNLQSMDMTFIHLTVKSESL